jgi:hypothetical protein
VDSEPQLWTAGVSSTEQDAVFPRMHTVEIQRSFMKVKRISYQKMSLFISGDPYRKIQKISNSKMTYFVKILEIRPISGQAVFSFLSFHAKFVWQRNRHYLDMSRKIIESFFEDL